MSEQDVREKLQGLTVAECSVLYWRCRGLSCQDVADQRSTTVGAVHFHLGNIYDELHLSDLTKHQRQLQLAQDYCPVLLETVKDPETDCAAFSSHREKRRRRPKRFARGPRQLSTGLKAPERRGKKSWHAMRL